MNSIDNSDCHNLPILDTELLSAFVAVVENGGFTAAARQLHKTQSTISQRIRTLEERIGVSLLHRTSRQLSLTPDGETFLVYARRLLQLQREAISSLGHGDREGVIRFGLPENYAEAWLPRLLDRFAQRHPRVRPHIHCRMSSELIEALEGGELDLALTVRHANHGNGEALGAETLVWAAHRDFRQDPKAALPLALFPDHCPYRQRALDSLTRQGRRWSLQYTSQSPTGLRMAVNQRNAVTVVDRRTLPADWRILDETDGLPPLPPAQLELHRSPSCQHPAGDDLIDLLRDLLAAELQPADAGRHL
ncbi:LysR substrate-binding domain-containing protein [Halomonas nitroreducens]|uniref:LysR family transcriptional regulator n=1 Tax=Halomonas nitroreducens TaxID=447425 RepID=A0A3S0KQJ7_9GAMM|nr:LysR substrate-binding domain-containing protein [Halomonas nitroreducens]RTR02952.1 LysR family transcriptional regulator [Halomonas nitroreducens]